MLKDGCYIGCKAYELYVDAADLITRQAQEIERLTARAEQAERAVNKMAEYIVTLGRADYHLCDEIPRELHLKHQPKDDGNYDNANCIKCIAERYLSGLEGK